jgi:hypothetical protein
VVDLALLIFGNSSGMLIANLASIIIMCMLSWFVIGNLCLPEVTRRAINDKTIIYRTLKGANGRVYENGIPNWLIIQLYLSFCVLTVIFL